MFDVKICLEFKLVNEIQYDINYMTCSLYLFQIIERASITKVHIWTWIVVDSEKLEFWSEKQEKEIQDSHILIEVGPMKIKNARKI